MEQTRIHAGLCGKGRRVPADLTQLEEILVRFSHLIAEQRWIAEVDVNPLRVSESGVIALDSRIVLHSPDTKASELPRLAIRPYPVEYVRDARLGGIGRVTLRPIRPEDESLLVEFHRSLSDRSVHQRYFGNIPLDSRIAHERLARVCFCDYDREIALVAERRTRTKREIIGVGRINRVRGVPEAQFALLVGDPWQGCGVGTALLRALVEVGRAEGLTRITGTVLATNAAMQHVCRDAGFTLRRKEDEFAAHIDL